MTQIVDDLVRDEGFRAKAYRDHLGKLTIGIGFLIDPDEPGAIEMPRSVANLWMLDILRERRQALDAAIPWWTELSEGRQRALLNMAYQLGTAGLLKFKIMLALLEAKIWKAAAVEALDSRWAKQTPERAERIYELLKNG